MKTKIYTLKDNFTESFGNLFETNNDGEAVKQTINLLNDINRKAGYKAVETESFELWKVAERNDITFKIDEKPTKINITAEYDKELNIFKNIKFNKEGYYGQ